MIVLRWMSGNTSGSNKKWKYTGYVTGSTIDDKRRNTRFTWLGHVQKRI